jgi:hypothetical protein
LHGLAFGLDTIEQGVESFELCAHGRDFFAVT